MSLPNSLLAYQDCLDAFDAAIKDENGIRIRLGSREEATQFRMRMNYCRKLQRLENARIYDDAHPMHGKSDYDAIKCSVRSLPSGHYVYLEHQVLSESQIESLADVAEEAEVFVPPEPKADIPLVTESIKRRA